MSQFFPSGGQSIGVSALASVLPMNRSLQFEFFWALPFFGVGMKTDFFSSVTIAEIFIFAGTLSAALSQHHLLGFEIAQLEFHHLH